MYPLSSAPRILFLLPMQGGFTAELALKDMGHVRQLTRDVECPLPVADIVYGHLLTGKAVEGPDIDWNGAIFAAVQRAAGLPFKFDGSK